MHYTLLQSHAIFRGTCPFSFSLLGSTGVFCFSPSAPYIYPLYDVINHAYVLRDSSQSVLILHVARVYKQSERGDSKQ